jgi:carbon-monoxide dehydrogenase medium subunit
MTEFMTGPYQTALTPGELLVALHLPPQNLKSASAFFKLGVTSGGLPVVAAAAFVLLDDENNCLGARIAVGGIAPVAQLIEGVDERLVDWRGEPALAHATATDLAPSVPVQSDHFATAEYRNRVVAALSAEALLVAYRRAVRA